MKKSNKILFGGFLALLVFITAIHVTLYAKYKSGDYVTFNLEDELSLSTLQAFPNILFVSIQDVPYATARLSNVAKIDKEQEGLHYEQKGDTLLIRGKADNNGNSFVRHATFQLPANATLSLTNSMVEFKKGKTAAPINPVVYLQRSEARFTGEGSPLHLGNVSLVATDSSTAVFETGVKIDLLNAQLARSILESREGNVGQLSILTDLFSRLSLPSGLLLKANIKTALPK